MQAIRDTGNRLVAAADPADSVGILDRYFLDVRYFPEIERLDRHIEKARRGPQEDRVHYVTICSPNYLHDAHVRLALRSGCGAICEKPLVINPWNLDQLAQVEEETGGKVNTIMQLRLHPAVVALKERLAGQKGARHDVELTYFTGRGPWYLQSWKGNEDRSGGLLVNIGIHFFDMLLWLFGKCDGIEVAEMKPTRAAGVLHLDTADVRWQLSTDFSSLPQAPLPGKGTTFRRIVVDGEELEFSEGFTELHTRSYEEILAGRGFGIEDARPAILLVHALRTHGLH